MAAHGRINKVGQRSAELEILREVFRLAVKSTMEEYEGSWRGGRRRGREKLFFYSWMKRVHHAAFETAAE